MDPTRTALLLIDPYNDFLSEGGKLWPHAREVAERISLLPNLRALVAAARRAGVAVLFVPHRRACGGDFRGWRYLCPTHQRAEQIVPFERGTWGAEFHPDFQPQPGDVVVGEHWLHSGFANTDLALQLQVRGFDHLVICGMRANACIEGTARHAVELGYHVTIAKDATAAFRWEEWVATLEVNAPSFAHAILPTSEIVAALAPAARAA